MSKKIQVAVLVGSQRKDSFNLKMAKNMQELAPQNLSLKLLELSDLPIFNQDMEDPAKSPEPWNRLRREVREADAVLFVTPEYNRSIPPLLKNAIDIASRPYGQSSWQGKPGAVMSVSVSAAGGFGANHHLRQCMVFLNVYMMQQPEAYVGKAAESFDAQGLLKADTRKFVEEFLKGFAEWAARFVK